jgi:hypothetical protein
MVAYPSPQEIDALLHAATIAFVQRYTPHASMYPPALLSAMLFKCRIAVVCLLVVEWIDPNRSTIEPCSTNHVTAFVCSVTRIK